MFAYLVRLRLIRFAVLFVLVVAGRTANSANALPASSSTSMEYAIHDPFGVEIGPDGALYVTEIRTHSVHRIDLDTGQKQVVAGNGKSGYSGDGGPALEAALNEPYEVRFDRAGNMYFVEMRNHIVRRVDARTKTISTIAGTGKPGYSGDGGPAIAAQLNQPHSIVIDADGNVFIADIGNHRIRRVDANDSTISSIAGTGEKRLPTDGQLALGHPILGPRALYLDGKTLWIALREGHSVWRLSLDDGRLQHVAGTGKAGYTGDGGPARLATFNSPKGIAVSRAGHILLVDATNNALRRIDARTGTVETIIGSPAKKPTNNAATNPASAPQRPVEPSLSQPHGVCVAEGGTIFIGDTANHRVLSIAAPAPTAR